MTFLDDGALVGFWPLNEPSGTPFFKNYSRSFGRKPSGISFDMHVHTTSSSASFNEIADQSDWPGTLNVTDLGSGTNRYGFCVQGSSDFAVGSTAEGDGPHEKCLILGHGAWQHRRSFVGPPIPQSGFTVGLWVYPRSDGAIPFQGAVADHHQHKGLAQDHCLLGQHDGDDGFAIGVSGKLEEGAQFASEFDRHQLVAYAAPFSTNDNELTMLRTPIESGRFTHITFTYRFTDDPADNAELVLYKDGHVQASGEFDPGSVGNTLTLANPNVIGKVLSIGGTSRSEFPQTNDLYEDSTGWGHLVSGVYAYRRVLHEGEIEQLHGMGGMQPPLEDRDFKAVDLTDPKMIACYAFMGKGYLDVSKNHNILLADLDLSTDFDASAFNRRYFAVTGPHDRLGVRRNSQTSGGADTIALASTSGITSRLAASTGFTIACYRQFEKSTIDQIGLAFTWGSMGESDYNTARQTGGFLVGAVGGSDDGRLEAIVFNGGNADDRTELHSPSADAFEHFYEHIAFVYDDQTFGVALYGDGEQVASGTLSASMMPQLNRLAGSGFPLTFLGGTEANVIDLWGDSAGRYSTLADITILDRPLWQDEVRAIAHSGVGLIDAVKLNVQDPRLMGYWKGTDAIRNNAIVLDHAQVFQGEAHAGHLTRVFSDDRWAEVLSNPAGKEFQVDLFHQNAKLDLGITSGVYAVMGGSHGLSDNLVAGGTGDNRRTVATAFGDRFRVTEADRDNRSPGLGHELIWSFDVTPSGTVPPTFDTIDNLYNSLLMDYGKNHDLTTAERLFAFLTTNADAVLRLAWMTRDGTTATTPLVSGVVSYGEPNKILLHAKPIAPNIIGTAEQTSDVLFRMFVDGTLVSSQQVSSEVADFYPDALRQDWILQIGGRSAFDTFSTASNVQDGLGEIHMRNIFAMIGKFTEVEIQSLATNGIQDTSSLDGHQDEIQGKVVTNADSTLEGLWRFTDRVGVNGLLGVKDLSASNNTLDAIAQQADIDGVFASDTDNAFENLRFVPGPYASGLIPVQASGILYNGDTFTTTSAAPPFAVSGADFNDPQNGFSVGFWLAARDAAITSNQRRYFVGYGNSPIATSNNSFADASWQVFIDETSSVRLALSHDGRLNLDDDLDEVYMTSAGAYRSIKSDGIMELHKRGACDFGHKDAWNHYLWTFDRDEAILKCFLNGNLVDRKPTPASGFHVPLNPDSRMMTVYVPPEGEAWNFQNTDVPRDSVMTDLFYFSRALSDEEAHFIAMSGIAQGAPTPTSSGIQGGYVHGLDTGSGIQGAYVQGFDQGSGIHGGYIVGSVLGSGFYGGYIQGQNDGSGLAGGYVVGATKGSGILGAYIQGAGKGSGITGGFLLAGVPGTISFDTNFAVQAFGAADFDAGIQVRRNDFADFDAKIIVFQRELPPDVSIIVPDVTVSGQAPPFDQYFVGQATAQQGKTIDIARWNFGDFTPTVKVSPSGGNFYPVSHRFQGSGYYIVRLEVIDSNGLHNSATRVVDAASGVSPVLVTISGVPIFGSVPLDVQFTQTIEALPPNVAISTSLLSFDDGKTTSRITSPVHRYTEPGIYTPIWAIRDTRGIIWNDSIEPGIDLTG